MDENIIIRERESVLSLGFWIKMFFTLGLYFFWWRAKTLTVTDRQVILSKGVFAKNEQHILLNQVQGVSAKNKGLGFLFGHGTIRIKTAAGIEREMTFNFVNRHRKIRDAIMNQL